MVLADFVPLLWTYSALVQGERFWLDDACVFRTSKLAFKTCYHAAAVKATFLHLISGGIRLLNWTLETHFDIVADDTDLNPFHVQ